MFDFCIFIAGKKIRFKCESEELEYFPAESKEFREHLCSCDRVDMTFEIKYGSVPDFLDNEILFSVEQGWQLSKWRDSILIEYFDRKVENRVERVGVINSEFTRGVIYVNRERTEQEKALAEACGRKKRKAKDTGLKKRCISSQKISVKTNTDTPAELGSSVMGELKANFFQVFLVEYIARQRLGFMAHCATIQKNGKTYLFMGQSGAGKSTIVEILADLTGAVVYNDDRAVLNVINGDARFYNLPWMGTLEAKCMKGKGDKSEISGIFFLSHAKANNARQVSKIDAITRIFRNSFPVFWNKRDVNYIFSVCENIARKVPCYELGFVNDKRIVDFLRKENLIEI